MPPPRSYGASRGIRAAPTGRRGAALLVAVVLTLTAALCARPPAHAAHPAHPSNWLPPVPGLTVVRAFDPPAEDWQSGHRGVDLAALTGEEVRAPAAGTVRFAGSVGGKPVVSVNAGGWIMSLENVTAHVSTGDAVHAGHVLGVVADPPHCPQGCVHVGVWKDGEQGRYLDPLAFFGGEDVVLLPASDAPEELPALPPDSGGSGAGPWGGHRNGRIPAVAMCPLQSAPGHLLRCDAARSFDSLTAAYAQRFGTPIAVTDAYRTYESQVVLKRRKGRFAAQPGTSNHGWGLAVDLGGGINRFGTPQHEWMRQNAARFGWIHPSWARQGGRLPEAWHWEFAGGV